MGLRFRKSIKLAPGVKLNIGKKSIGVSAGGKFGGVSFNSKTGAHARASMPGTGLSYTTKISGSSQASAKAKSSLPSKPPKPKKPFYKRGWVITLAALTIVGAISSPESDSETPDPLDSVTVENIEPQSTPEQEKDIVPIPPSASNRDEHVQPESTPAMKPDPNPETAPISKLESKPEPDSNSAPHENGQKSEYVGSIDSDKYHHPNCRWAEKISPENEIWFDSKEDAQAAGYSPCGTCQ